MNLRRRLHSMGIRRSNAVVFCLYSGYSMKSILREFDLLEVRPYNDRPVVVGDVILFLPPESEQGIVHRVIDVISDGIYTRGDNNAYADSFRLKSSHIVGQVVAVWRSQHRRQIHGGWRGRFVAGLWRWLRPTIRKGYALLRRYGKGRQVVKWLRASVRFFWNPRIVVFHADAGRSAKLLLGTRVIGHYTQTQQAWHIQQPFRLLIDPRILPTL
jgi:signal peptidase I